MLGLIVPLLVAQMPALASPCGRDVPMSAHGVCTITPDPHRPLPAISGPARLCSKHFAVILRRGDRLAARRLDDASLRYTIVAAEGTLSFGEEMFRDFAVPPLSLTRWRRDVLRTGSETGLPYHLVDASGRYMIQQIDGTALHGDRRDARPLVRLRARTPTQACATYLDLGNLGYADDPR